MKTKLIYIVFLFGVIIIQAELSCKKYPDPAPVFEDYGSDSGIVKQRKVLVIGIDGATGSEIQTIAPPNIMALLDNAKYSFSLQLDATLTDASSWASILTGVGVAKNSITDSTFDVGDNSGSGGNFEGSTTFYPNIYTYILQNKSQYETAMITPWSSLAHYSKIADYSIAAANDEAVKDSAISVLKSSNPLGFMVTEFNEAEIAGNEGSFSASDAGYKTAVLQCDTYVNDILQALKSRENYNNEDWLVIVTTNHGGSANFPKPGFIVYNNASFEKQEVKKNGFNTVAFNGSGSSAVYATLNGTNTTSVYDFNKDFTIQLDVLMPTNSGSYPTFFGNKTQLGGGSTPGFSLIRDGGPTWTFNTTSGSKFQVQAAGIHVEDGAWHTVSVTYKADSRIVSVYTDGVFQKSGKAPSGINMNGPDPLSVGCQPSAEGAYNTDNINITPHNIEIFNKALDSTTIAQNICLRDITKHPNYANLTGFWACDDGQGSKMQNTINSVYSFQLQGAYKWTGFSLGMSLPCSVNLSGGDVSNQISIIPYSVDVTANTMYWLGINISSDWGIDGTSWLDNF